MQTLHSDIAIVGAGLSGLATALALSQTSLRIMLLDAGSILTTGFDDTRASFLAASSLRMLDRLGVEASVQPVTDILNAEALPGEPIRPGSLHFEGDLGAVVENFQLRYSLLSQLGHGTVDIRPDTPVTALATGPGYATLITPGGPLTARLVIAADGRKSPLRRLSGIGTRRHDYEQSALTFTLAHTQPHNGVAYQIMFPGGPLALLPLPPSTDHPHRSSIVWSDSPKAISAACALPTDALLQELHTRIGNHLGDLSLASPLASYPLTQILAHTVTTDRLALVGDSAHLIHPLAGQGLNLGLRDAAAIADIVGEAHSLGRDIGGPALADYARWRAADINGMALATDALSHAYRAPLGPLRRLATSIIDSSPLKAFLVSEASGERPNLPALMA